jgi:hypothetical protein
MHVHDWNPHDLRRTAATLIARLGVPRFIIERVLNHRDSSVGGIYDRYSYANERKDAVTKLGVRVNSLAKASRLLSAGLPAVEVGRAPQKWSFTAGLPILCLIMCLHVAEEVRNIDTYCQLEPSLS